MCLSANKCVCLFLKCFFWLVSGFVGSLRCGRVCSFWSSYRRRALQSGRGLYESSESVFPKVLMDQANAISYQVHRICATQ